MKNNNKKRNPLIVIICLVFIIAVSIILPRMNFKRTASGEEKFMYAQKLHQVSGECYVDGSTVQEPTVIKIPKSAKVIKMGEDEAKVCTVMGIAPEAFKDEKKLEEITIPATVKEIGEDAFAGCSQIKKVTFLGSKEEWDAIRIEKGNENLTAVNIDFK